MMTYTILTYVAVFAFGMIAGGGASDSGSRVGQCLGGTLLAACGLVAFGALVGGS